MVGRPERQPGAFTAGFVRPSYGTVSATGVINVFFTAVQVLQGVTDDVRGVVYGVQNSVNMMMNTAKFVLVIWLPTPATFGHLIGVSFTAVCTG